MTQSRTITISRQSSVCGGEPYRAVAVDDAGKIWTWGFGGYGRLGHKVQKVGMCNRL